MCARLRAQRLEQTMSLSSEKIYKRKPSIILRQQLLKVLLGKYIKKVYYSAVADRQSALQSNAPISASGQRQLLRHEYYNDIYECLSNNCQLNRIANAPFVDAVNRYTIPTDRRQFIASIKRKPKQPPSSPCAETAPASQPADPAKCAKRRASNDLPR